MNDLKEKYLKDFNEIYDNLYGDIERKYKETIEILKKKNIERIDRITELKHRIYELEEVEIEILKIKMEALEKENRSLKAEILEYKKNIECTKVIVEDRKDKAIDILRNKMARFSGTVKEEKEIKEIINKNRFLEVDLTESDKEMITFLVIIFKKSEMFKKSHPWFKDRVIADRSVRELEKLVRFEKDRRENYCYCEIPEIHINKEINKSTVMSKEIKEKMLKICKGKLIPEAKEIYKKKIGVIECEKNHDINSGLFYIKLKNKMNDEYYMLKKWGGICTECNKAYVNIEYVPKNYEIVNLKDVEETYKILNYANGEKSYSFIPTENQVNNSENKNKAEVGNLKEESDLKRLGYSTRLGRAERERILRNVAIPRLGKQTVINHLKWLIKMNGRRKGMENSIYIWENDLRKIV